MLKFILIITSVIFISCGHPTYKDPHILIVTGLGDIEVELYPDKAPKTVAAFLSNIKEEIYTGSSFYRVLKAEELPTDYNTGIIQGGIWNTSVKEHSSVKGIIHESTKQSGLSHTDAVISMARKESGSATTEFFICIGDQSSLDYGKGSSEDGLGFAAFGKVVGGMNIVKKIHEQKSRGHEFIEKIQIREIKQL